MCSSDLGIRVRDVMLIGELDKCATHLGFPLVTVHNHGSINVKARKPRAAPARKSAPTKAEEDDMMDLDEVETETELEEAAPVPKVEEVRAVKTVKRRKKQAKNPGAKKKARRVEAEE